MNWGKYQVVEYGATGRMRVQIKGCRTLSKALFYYYQAIKQNLTKKNKRNLKIHRIYINSFVFFDLLKNKQFYYIGNGEYAETSCVDISRVIGDDMVIDVRHLIKLGDKNE